MVLSHHLSCSGFHLVSWILTQGIFYWNPWFWKRRWKSSTNLSGCWGWGLCVEFRLAIWVPQAVMWWLRFTGDWCRCRNWPVNRQHFVIVRGLFTWSHPSPVRKPFYCYFTWVRLYAAEKIGDWPKVTDQGNDRTTIGKQGFSPGFSDLSGVLQ